MSESANYEKPRSIRVDNNTWRVFRKAALDRDVPLGTLLYELLQLNELVGNSHPDEVEAAITHWDETGGHCTDARA